MRRPLVAGNWKMNTSLPQARALARDIAAVLPLNCDIVVCPPFPWLLPVAECIEGSPVQLGAQNCWTQEAGAFTGEVSPAMLSGLCQYVIVGHSERRAVLGESDELVAAKVRAALRNELTPIFCVGESLAVREAGDAERHVRGQLISVLAGLTPAELSRCVIAYEPIWAIGTGRAAAPDDAAAMAGAVRVVVRSLHNTAGDAVRVLYGGSVTAENAGVILGGSDVDGALVGGASLQAESFLTIARAAAG